MKTRNAAKHLAAQRRRTVRSCLECGDPMLAIAIALRHPDCAARAKVARRRARRQAT